MNDGELELLRARVHALDEAKLKLDDRTGAQYKRLEAQILADLEQVQSKLKAMGMSIAKHE